MRAALTPETAANMSAVKLMQTCADQIDAQHPGASDEEYQQRTFELFAALATEKHEQEMAREGFMQIFDEITLDEAALAHDNLLDPVLKDGHPAGVILWRSGKGEEMLVGLRFATVQQLERPYHLHHRAKYREAAKRLREAGHMTYEAGWEAGLFGGDRNAEHGA